MNIFLADEAATEDLGRALAKVCPAHCLIFLKGDLGAGKTTFSRGFLRGLGYTGRVKSPTYTLLEPYDIPSDDKPRVQHVCHFDLYRLADPEELAYLGAEDCFADGSVILVEWPEQGEGMLPVADVTLFLQYRNSSRQAHLLAGTKRGQQLLQLLASPQL